MHIFMPVPYLLPLLRSALQAEIQGKETTTRHQAA
jgi:hypothetical protein